MRDNIEIATAAPSAFRFMAVALPGTQFMLTALPKMKSEIGPVIKKKLCQRNCQNIISNISGNLIEKNSRIRLRNIR